MKQVGFVDFQCLPFNSSKLAIIKFDALHECSFEQSSGGSGEAASRSRAFFKLNNLIKLPQFFKSRRVAVIGICTIFIAPSRNIKFHKTWLHYDSGRFAAWATAATFFLSFRSDLKVFLLAVFGCRADEIIQLGNAAPVQDVNELKVQLRFASRDHKWSWRKYFQSNADSM